MSEEKPKRYGIAFTPRMVEMVNEIMNNRGLMSFSAAVHFAVAELYKKDNPAYVALRTNETPADRMLRKKQEKEAKEDMARADQLAILEALGGQLINKEGSEVAVYFTYSGKKRFEQDVSLSMLTTDLVKTQYQPSRERVEQLQAEGKVDYKI